MNKNMKKWGAGLLAVALLTGGWSLSAAAAPTGAIPTGTAPTEAVPAGITPTGATPPNSMPAVTHPAAARPAEARPAEVFVGGMPFGVKFYTEGLLVVGFCDVDSPEGSVNPARAAGLRERDVIVGVNGSSPVGASALSRAAEASGGGAITLRVRRPPVGGRKGGRATELDVTVTPVPSVSEGRYKTGLWVRDSGVGIGTVTFILPGSNAFGGLGHGICDGDTGELVPLRRGQVTDVRVSGVERGAVGEPGAIRGSFVPGKTGSLLSNTECGVFGVMTRRPAAATTRLPVATPREVTPGEATLLCAPDGGEVRAFRIRINTVDPTATGSKCFTLTVTDPALLKLTGGIVQGMSGSPIIQNGKLVGAVTHVLINDPTTGYGIFIENMLNAAHMPMARAS